MNRIAQMEPQRRGEIFTETAARLGVADAIAEKDFWVCWVLQQLFTIDNLSERLLFKGGTSLSKIYKVIQRYSEYIDLAVDFVALGFTGDNDPRRPELSRTQRQRILDNMLMVCREYIAGEFIAALRTRCEQILGTDSTWVLSVEEGKPDNVLFSYPPSATPHEYVRSQVVLELGTHAEFIPHGTFGIRSFVAEEFPKLMEEAEVSVEALLAKRTFWEKATILHAEYHRPAEKPTPPRYSRHYYDLAMMAQSKIREEALADRELLAAVVQHKQIFYAATWARYDLAHPPSLMLYPNAERIQDLREDYRRMGGMIFGQAPAFDTILQTLQELQNEING
jgi:hypothetical protein